jgi:Na+/melibiose symporter-like transporter
MKLASRLFAAVCAVAAVFLTAVVVVALVRLAGGNYSLKPLFAVFVVGALVLYFAAFRLWRRPSGTRTSAPTV